MRGRMVSWQGDGQGYGTPYEHYWIIVSRSETSLSKGGKHGPPPLLVVPINSYDKDNRSPSDVEVKGLLEEGRLSVIRCGQLRALRRMKKLKLYEGCAVNASVMELVDEALVHALDLDVHIQKLIKAALQAHGVNVEV
jgi:hypothetical protein